MKPETVDTCNLTELQNIPLHSFQTSSTWLNRNFKILKFGFLATGRVSIRFGNEKSVDPTEHTNLREQFLVGKVQNLFCVMTRVADC